MTEITAGTGWAGRENIQPLQARHKYKGLEMLKSRAGRQSIKQYGVFPFL